MLAVQPWDRRVDFVKPGGEKQGVVGALLEEVSGLGVFASPDAAEWQFGTAYDPARSVPLDPWTFEALALILAITGVLFVVKWGREARAPIVNPSGRTGV